MWGGGGEREEVEGFSNTLAKQWKHIAKLGIMLCFQG